MCEALHRGECHPASRQDKSEDRTRFCRRRLARRGRRMRMKRSLPATKESVEGSAGVATHVYISILQKGDGPLSHSRSRLCGLRAEMFNLLRISKLGKCQRKATPPTSSASQTLTHDNGIPSGWYPCHSRVLPRYSLLIPPGVLNLTGRRGDFYVLYHRLPDPALANHARSYSGCHALLHPLLQRPAGHKGKMSRLCSSPLHL